MKRDFNCECNSSCRLTFTQKQYFEAHDNCEDWGKESIRHPKCPSIKTATVLGKGRGWVRVIRGS